MHISEFAERTGFAVSQIRYYERRGLLPPPARSPSGYRLYSEADVARLRLLRQTKLLGLSLAEVGELLEAAEKGCCNETQPPVRRAVERRIAEVDQQITQLRALRATLKGALIGESARLRAAGDSCGSEFCLPRKASE